MDRAITLHTIQEHNILPITSYCNSKCVFCSHCGNPEELRTISLGMRSLSELEEDITFLNAHKDIIIGESATRIIEGEPFLHPHIEEILVTLRKKFPKTLIKITTNATRLTEHTAKLLSDLRCIELNISLNSVSPEQHKKLMGNVIAEDALKNGLWLKKYDIPFHGSLVAMPWITGWDEIEATLTYLQAAGAVTIRVFMPGYSHKSSNQSKFPDSLLPELKSFISKMRKKMHIPILLEPPLLEDLRPEIAGVLQGSPADKIGLKQGDTILKVNAAQMHSRVEAWQEITESNNPKLLVIDSTGVENEITLKKSRNQKSGIVCEYDLDWKRAAKLREIQGQADILTSALAYPIIKQLPELLNLNNLRVFSVTNITFGGSIACSGLLSLRDIEAFLQKQEISGHIILPYEMFDYRGEDLFGTDYLNFAKQHKTTISII